MGLSLVSYRFTMLAYRSAVPPLVLVGLPFKYKDDRWGDYG